MLFCFFCLLCLYVEFSKYVSKDEADPEIKSYKNTFFSKAVGDEPQPFPIFLFFSHNSHLQHYIT